MAGRICNSSGEYLKHLAALAVQVDTNAIDSLAELLHQAWRERHRVFVCGNGGSAYTASHIVCDLVKTAAVEGRHRLQVFGLGDNVGMLTAVGNDIAYDDVFRYPLASYAQAGDLLIAVTASGNSVNILKACEWAAGHGLCVIAIAGFAGGKVKAVADLYIGIPSDNYGLIEDLQLSVGHVVAQILRSRIEGAPPAQRGVCQKPAETTGA